MKTIMLLRHGKSNWDADYKSDHERPLAVRGQKASARLGKFLKANNSVPDQVITSTATRARETLDLAMIKGGWKSPVIETRDLYFSSPERILDIIRKQSDSLESLLLVGHNPTWEDFLSLLVAGGSFRMPTAALAKVRFLVSHWSEVREGTGILEYLVTPKVLKRLSTGWL
jgi:phosphohistidine phosphatase